MFGSGILNAVIGLVFIFLLVSMLVTILNEMIAALLLSRAKWLKRGIERLIGPVWMCELYAHPLIEGSAISTAGPRRWLATLRGQGPSYIPSGVFASVLLSIVQGHCTTLVQARAVLKSVVDAPVTDPEGLAAAVAQAAQTLKTQALKTHSNLGATIAADLLRLCGTPNSLQTPAELSAAVQRFSERIPARYIRQALEDLDDDRLRQALLTLLDDTGNEAGKLRENIETWFNNGMDRVNGWYKRRSQAVILILALATVVVTNVDSLLIFQQLQTNPALAETLVAQAARLTQIEPAAGLDLPAQLDATRQRLAELAVPVGWVRTGDPSAQANGQILPATFELSAYGDLFRRHWLGWLLTALAATLGAPFWFDLLNRIISIRAAGKRPETDPLPPRLPTAVR